MQITKDRPRVFCIDVIQLVLGGNLEEQTNERFLCVSRQLNMFNIWSYILFEILWLNPINEAHKD